MHGLNLFEMEEQSQQRYWRIQRLGNIIQGS